MEPVQEALAVVEMAAAVAAAQVEADRVVVAGPVGVVPVVAPVAAGLAVGAALELEVGQAQAVSLEDG